MAGIDKTYLDSYQDYIDMIDWCNKIGTITDEYGNKFNPKDFIYEPNLEEEDFRRGMILWNTPIYFDIFLIRNCNIPFIQERLLEQYDEDFVKRVLNHTSEYDTFERNGLGKNLKFTILKRPTNNYCFKDNWWWIRVEGTDYDWNYNEDEDTWVHHKECREYNTNVCTKYRGKLTLKKIARILRKWNLPAGLDISISGSYVGQQWLLRTK